MTISATNSRIVPAMTVGLSIYGPT
jgi:hypothetical protein